MSSVHARLEVWLQILQLPGFAGLFTVLETKLCIAQESMHTACHGHQPQTPAAVLAGHLLAQLPSCASPCLIPQQLLVLIGFWPASWWYNVCQTCPIPGFPWVLWKVLRRLEIWAKAGASMATIVILVWPASRALDVSAASFLADTPKLLPASGSRNLKPWSGCLFS